MFSLANFFLLAQFWHFFHWKNRNASQARVYLCVWVYIERQNLKHHTKLVESTYVCFLTESPLCSLRESKTYVWYKRNVSRLLYLNSKLKTSCFLPDLLPMLPAFLPFLPSAVSTPRHSPQTEIRLNSLKDRLAGFGRRRNLFVEII